MARQPGAAKLMRVRRATAPGSNNVPVNKAAECMQELAGTEAFGINIDWNCNAISLAVECSAPFRAANFQDAPRKQEGSYNLLFLNVEKANVERAIVLWINPCNVCLNRLGIDNPRFWRRRVYPHRRIPRLALAHLGKTVKVGKFVASAPQHLFSVRVERPSAVHVMKNAYDCNRQFSQVSLVDCNRRADDVVPGT